ncbi:histone deacetylase 8-like isoform X3 [Macrobrachium rosenbergii]|uniref:histone deacetylase 8-like isoform X3 n=1 Tax=Macrobrachium rosenbergii TaxID=79674 RepID=UPI0034D660F8
MMTAKGPLQACYVADPKLLMCCDAVPIIRHRACLTHSLITAYGLLDKLKVIPSVSASEEEVRKFHSEEYVDFLKTAEANKEDVSEDEFGLGFDCPVLENMWMIVKQIAGGTLTAARALVSRETNIAINWCGGWHHAQRDSASGFCYVNDVVLGILELRTKFDKILYIDLDIHHEKSANRRRRESGTANRQGSTVHFSIAIHMAIFPTGYSPFLPSLLSSASTLYNLCEVYMPDAIVCQCGADVISGDPLGGANVTPEGFKSAIRHVLNLNKPTLFLGGGGYNKINAAKLWTSITASILNMSLSPEIPEHQYFPHYGPSFELEVTAGLRKSENTEKTLDDTIRNVHYNIEHLAVLLGKK